MEYISKNIGSLKSYPDLSSKHWVNGDKKFPWRYDENDRGCVRLKEALASQIAELVENGVTDFLSGMAEGVDIWGARIVLALRERTPALKLHCILPCREQADKWSASAREAYRSILAQADSIVYVSRSYHKNCMLERNRFLVDHASILLAVYNGEPRGGTAATVRYARKLDREIHILDPATFYVASDDGNGLVTMTP